MSEQITPTTTTSTTPTTTTYTTSTTSTTTPTTSTTTPSTTPTTTSSNPTPSTSSSTSSTPSIYDTNNNDIYNFPLLHNSSSNVSSFFKNFNLTPGVLIIFLIVIIVFVFIFSSLGKNNSSENSSNNSWFGSKTTDTENGGGKSHILRIIIIVIIVIILSMLYRHFEGSSIIASIKKLFTKSPEVTVTATKTPLPPPTPKNNVPEIKLYKEVFNIPGNNYTYSQAESICSAYGAKLASYDELEEAYKRGGEWCNYGWSEGQMALFPTQKKTYDKLKTIKGHEHDCGRPGINGGYIANPNVRFGINCYGHKPKRTEIEKELMENTTPYPLTKEEMLMQKQVDYWKTQLPNIIVSPFNSNRWSKI
jgi:hypothetical protein